jgi:undecaprenyl-diphosphatase
VATEIGTSSARETRMRSNIGARDSRHAIARARQWAIGLALAFAALAALVGAGITDGMDRWMSELAQSLAWPPLDLVASCFNVLGNIEVTAPVAVLLAFFWWRRDGARGLVPFLLFAGVALEVILKHALTHPGPPEELSRSVRLLPPLMHGSSPYSFPSGHMLRVTFLAALMAPRWAFWLLAGAMALSRVYLNEHWTSDVIGGFLLGLSLAGFAASLYRDPEA